MEYNTITRKQLEDRFKEDWEQKHALKIKRMSKDEKELLDNIQNTQYMYILSKQKDLLAELAEKNTDIASLSDFIRQNYDKYVQLFVPKEFRDDYYYILDKCNQFQYSESRYRRSVRTANYGPQLQLAFRLMRNYYAFGIYGCGIRDISKFLRDELSEELVNYKYNHSYSYNFVLYELDLIIMARIDKGDIAVIDTIKETFTSENNTVVVTEDIVRAVVKSSDRELHKLLGRFLLAARLSEGVRQVICENADCGTIEAFMEILDVIQSGNLVRFAAVKRAIATWTGICNIEHMDRITNKVLDDIILSVRDKKQALEFTKSEDAVHIVMGLWSLGFYEINDAIDRMKQILKEGSRVQLLAMSYYNLSFEHPKIAGRIANKVMEKYPEDMELVAAYMPTYMEKASRYILEIYKELTEYLKNIEKVQGKSPSDILKEKNEIIYMPWEYLFDSEKQAREHFGILKGMYEKMEKKAIEINPLVFPWYGVRMKREDILCRMSLIAYMFHDEDMVDYVCTRFDDIGGNYYDRGRHTHIVTHLYSPKTDVQRKALINYVADKDSNSRDEAAKLVRNLELTEAEYETLEGFLKYKNEGMRRNIISILELRDDEGLKTTIGRLLDSKQSMIRLAGLDILKKRKADEVLLESMMERVKNIVNPDSEETILIEELSEGSSTDRIVNSRGYGLYNPDEDIVEETDIRADVSVCGNFFNVSAKKVSEIFERLYAFIDEHCTEEYKDADGEEKLLGNMEYGEFRLSMVSREPELPIHKKYPFEHLWREFYDEQVKSLNVLLSMRMAFQFGNIEEIEKGQVKTYLKHEKKLFGDMNSEFVIPASKYFQRNAYFNGVRSIVECMISMNETDIPREVAKHAVAYVIQDMPKEELWYDYAKDSKVRYQWRQYQFDKVLFTDSRRFKEYIRVLKNWKNDEEYKESFILLYHLDKKIALWDMVVESSNSYSVGLDNGNILNLFYYIKAYTLGIISEDMVYKAAFEMMGIRESVKELSVFMLEKLRPYEINQLKGFVGKEGFDKESDFYKTGVRMYKKVIGVILEVELRRGDSPTIFSKAAAEINKIYGIDSLIAILNALGKSTLDRSSYYYSYSNGESKKSVLSHLLQVCYPLENEDGNQLKEKAEKNKISEKRLIEVAMYAPQWLDIIGDCLGYSGLKSGCYYFMAHMNEYFDDKKMAMIAKYTPLSKEELNQGCFDVKWFREAYETLGEELFDKLYVSAKYISDGSKHSRARKYADAALGRVTIQELETEIDSKRNKDLLMSYGIVPVKGTEDILHRYEYLQKFRKESKQFGAQRRASEGAAVDTALKNLATAAGYSDEIRLILAMETEMVKNNMRFFEWNEIEDCNMKISVDNMGKVSICVEKNGKALKSVPAALKKKEQYLEIKALYDKLRAQYSRTVAMFEKSMEDREEYTFGELKMLCENPVIRCIVENMVYVEGKENQPKYGLISQGRLKDLYGDDIDIEDETKLRIAHPYDLYIGNVWEGYQRVFFEKNKKDGIRQPFKQVFRELYVKLEEEKDKYSSLMFAGNQIQPKKTIACLKGRRWIADYEDGLQKVYYKDDIIAGIYAVADWYSPADTEEPVLEWVTFTNRKTLKSMKISEVPDIVYSEVMRDVDLAVSVAHAGGVDPETSHSTVEMRKVVLEFNLELFGISNVSFEKNHAMIEGKRGRYSVHLGSGVVHKIGGHQINIIAVQGSKRSKIFLPFIDGDPKTAEIMSKVLMLAEDDKIKDPYIMEQIMK